MDSILNYINQIIALIGGVEALIAALVGAATAGIIAYQKLKKLWAMRDLEQIAAPLMAIAETKPQAILDKIINKPAHLDGSLTAVSLSDLTSNASKTEIVGTAAFEVAKKEKKSILNRLGINSAADMINLMPTIYQSVAKPIIKSLKK
jgi:hypothetical protein